MSRRRDRGVLSFHKPAAIRHTPIRTTSGRETLRRYIALIAAAAAALLASAPAEAQIITAEVTGGKIEGTAEGNIGVFKGIPFAAPPVGNLRWKDPQPLVPWKGVKPTGAYGPACTQATSMLQMVGAESRMSEDCLYLNIWTPAKAAGEKLPVMVWIYGGAFVAGTTSSAAFDGTNFARRGIVLVSISYRVGPLGWLAHPELSREQGGTSGNYGLKDQIAALRWVHDNIAQFGGDAGNITIFGESAGGISTGMLAVSPPAKGLYAKAISESGGNFAVPSDDPGPGQGTRTMAAAEGAGVKSVEGLGVRSIAEARALSADAIMKMQGSNWPIYDGKVLPDDPWRLYDQGRFNDMPVLIGSNSDEGGLFMRQPVEPGQFEASIRRQYSECADRARASYPHDTPAEAGKSRGDMMREQVQAVGQRQGRDLCLLFRPQDIGEPQRRAACVRNPLCLRHTAKPRRHCEPDQGGRKDERRVHGLLDQFRQDRRSQWSGPAPMAALPRRQPCVHGTGRQGPPDRGAQPRTIRILGRLLRSSAREA